MDLTTRSTSALMKLLFGSDLNRILGHYNGVVASLSRENPFLSRTFRGCFSRTGFLFPYMSAEYGHHAVTGRLLPGSLRNPVTGFGLIGLAVSVDDDVADEFREDHYSMVAHLSASELLQNRAYELIFREAGSPESSMVMDEIARTMHNVAMYQLMDARNMEAFRKMGFDITEYLRATHKTVCPIKHGLRLGALLGGGREYLAHAERIGERLGVVLQLIDDLIDLRDDLRNYDNPVTLPMFLLDSGQPFSVVYGMIESHIREAERVARAFPSRDRLLSMAAGFRQAAELAKTRLESELPGLVRSPA